MGVGENGATRKKRETDTSSATNSNDKVGLDSFEWWERAERASGSLESWRFPPRSQLQRSASVSASLPAGRAVLKVPHMPLAS